MVSDSAVYRKAKEQMLQRILSGEWRDGPGARRIREHRDRLEEACTRTRWGKHGISYREVRRVLDLGGDQTEREKTLDRLAGAVADGWEIPPTEEHQGRQLRRAIREAKREDGLEWREAKVWAARLGILEAAADMRTRLPVRVSRQWVSADEDDPTMTHMDQDGRIGLEVFWTLSIKQAKEVLATRYLPPKSDDLTRDVPRIRLPDETTSDEGVDPDDNRAVLGSEASDLYQLLTEHDPLEGIYETETLFSALEMCHTDREQEVVLALAASEGDRRDAAKLLGVSPSTIGAQKSKLKRRRAEGE